MNDNRFSVMGVYGLAVILMAACAPEPAPIPTASVEPSETAAIPTETSMPEPTASLIPPTGTPGPTRTPRPSTTPRPSQTPIPTLTPTDTPRPSLGAGPFRAVVTVDGVIPGEIGGLHATPDGTLWLYSDQAVARLQADETWAIFLPEYEGEFAGIDALGRVWIADFDLAGIAAWDGLDWIRYGEESGWVPPGPGLYTSHPVQAGPYFDASGRLWLATVADVRAFDGQQWFIFNWEAMGMAPPEVEDTSVYRLDIYQNVIWVGECEIFGPGPGPGLGVRWFDGEWHGSDSPLATGCVTALTASRDGQIWIGADDRLWQTDPHGETWTSITMPEEAVGTWNFGYPVSLKVGPSGDDLWAAYMMCGGACCEGPLIFFHIEDGVWTRIAETDPYYPGLQLITLDDDGTPWLFSAEGIDRVIDNQREPVANLIVLSLTQDATRQVWFIAERDGQNWLWTLDGSSE